MSTIVLIQEPDEVISLDLAQTIKDAWPDGTVILCRTTAEAMARLAAARLPHVIILHQSLRAATASGLAELAVQQGVCVLLTAADEDEDDRIAALGWQAIDMPYTPGQIQASLRHLMASRNPTGQGGQTLGHCKAVALG